VRLPRYGLSLSILFCIDDLEFVIHGVDHVLWKAALHTLQRCCAPGHHQS
jgi:hypothetical protein